VRWPPARRWSGALIILLVAVAVAVLLALSLSGSTTTAAGPSVGIGQSSLGKILVNGRGLTLYMYTHDKHRGSACSEACAQVWPPVLATGASTLAPGLAGSKLKTIRRSDHRKQLAYNGHPLYTFSEDTRPGQKGGEAFLGAWFVLSRSGRPVKPPGYHRPSGGY
jgi:predicted lipoprotein with Yx(FWY)xxD motif